MKTRKVSLPMQTRIATVQPKTLNKENRTVEVVFTTGARVRRASFWDGPFIEELGLKKKEVRMGRLRAKAPFLDTHGFGGQSGVRNVLGVVESAELIPEKEGRAVIRFSKRAEVEDIFRDVEDGILANVSVGYNTHRFEKVGEENKIPIFRATDWEPAEISLVPVGADPKSQVRNEDGVANDCEIVNNENETIKEDETRIESEDNETLAQSDNLSQNRSIGENTMPKTKEEIEKARKEADLKLRQDATAAERTRAKDIRDIVCKVRLDEKLASEYIEAGKSVDEVRTLVIDEVAKRDSAPANQTSAINQVRVGEDLSRKGRVEGMESAILHRFRPEDETISEQGKDILFRGHKLVESGRDYAYLSLFDMARVCLEAKGIRTGGLSRNELAMRGLHSTSDFPEILANVLNKTLRAGYQAAPQTWKPFTREVFVNDFKEISRTNLGDAANLELVPEGGEVKRGTMSEAAEKYNIDEYAKIIGITRKVIINDDLDMVTRIPEKMGIAARDLESDLIWNIIKVNAVLSDSVALFAAGHGNLSTVPAAPSETGLNEARAAMRRQVGLDSRKISIIPAWIFVPPAHETATEKLIATTRPNNASDVNPFGPQGRTTLRMDVEPRLEDAPSGSLTAWFVMANKGQIDMIELARLSGSNGPQTFTREGFDVNGMEIKIMHDAGAKAIDHRGMFKNAGA